MKSRRVAIAESSHRCRHTSTTLDASTFDPRPRIRLPNSVRSGQVPLTARPALIIAYRRETSSATSSNRVGSPMIGVTTAWTSRAGALWPCGGRTSFSGGCGVLFTNVPPATLHRLRDAGQSVESATMALCQRRWISRESVMVFPIESAPEMVVQRHRGEEKRMNHRSFDLFISEHGNARVLT